MLATVILAWVLGAGSLICFAVFLSTGGFGLIDLQLARNSLLTFDAALCLTFFLQHSILIRRSVRRSLRKLTPEHYYGVAYTISSSIPLLALVLLWQRSPVHVYELHGSGYWLVRAVLLVALLGFVWGFLSFKRFDAFGTAALLAHARREQVRPPKITAKGAYGWMRHPFYASGLLAVWATPALSLDRLLFNLLFTGWIVLGTFLEERDLLSQFGEEYARYQHAVPMFIPNVRRSRGSTTEKVNATSAGRAS